MTAPVLSVENLACGYGEAPVLEHVSFDVSPGEFVGILGPNGTGKSTLLKTVARLLSPKAGEVRLSGRQIQDYAAKDLAKQMAYVPQHLPPDAGWRVEEVVAMGRFPHQRGWGMVGGAADADVVASAIATAQVSELVGRSMETLSGGQRQRVYLARALAQEAPLLMFDEPTAHLDVSHQLTFFRLVREVLATRGATAVAVLHDLNMAAQFCHRLLVLKEGMLLADGTPDEVIEPALVEEAFGLAVEVRHHPETGRPYILPIQLQRRSTGTLAGSGHLRGAQRAHVHVIAGGGSGERLLPELYRQGFELSVGVVNALDSDQVTASRLGLGAIVEAPFSPISEANRALLAEHLARAEQVVVCGVAWGAGNVANLRVLAEHGGGNVWLVADEPPEARDFTGGEALALWERLVASGARVVRSRELVAALKA